MYNQIVFGTTYGRDISDMAIPKEQPMLTVKEAAKILGVDPRTIREKLATKQIRGEKRLHGLKAKWYVNKADIDALAEEQYDRGVEEHQERVDVEDMEGLFDDDEVDALEINEVNEPSGTPKSKNDQLEMLIGTLTKQFSKELSEHQELVFQLKKEIDEKDKQLKLLPDLEKEAQLKRKEAETKEFELQALKKQLDLIKEEKVKTEEDLSCSKEELEEREKEVELAVREKSVTEKESESLKAEFEKVKKELEEKSLELSEYKKPWWKKWFYPQEATDNK